MTEAFEIWAPREISRLRQEAETLQSALESYLSAKGGTRKSRAQVSNDGPARKSKHERLFSRWAEASRDRPISYSEMEAIAEEEQAGVTRTQLRTIVHTQKQSGRVRAEGDGYVWTNNETEPMPSTKEGIGL